MPDREKHFYKLRTLPTIVQFRLQIQVSYFDLGQFAERWIKLPLLLRATKRTAAVFVALVLVIQPELLESGGYNNGG